METAKRIRVLLVEDHTIIRQGVQSLLEFYSNIEIVGGAADGEQAVWEVSKLQPAVVVMDINMPNMDGIMATRLIKTRYPQIAVVGLSVNAKGYHKDAMLKAGSFEVVTKDEAADQLYSAIQRAVAAVQPVLILEETPSSTELRADSEHSAKPAPTEPLTLGDLLYAKSKGPVPEQDWVTLVKLIAAGDQLALHGLYEMAHRIVFTLIMRITANRETAEELTIDVFHDVWRRAARYDAANGTVIGWIMNQARTRAIDRVRESRKERSHGGDMEPLAEVAAEPGRYEEARLARRIAEETGKQPTLLSARRWSEPEWEQVAPGIECKLLATDTERQRVSMLVRLAPGASYPGHTHAGVEELHLLDGELWIDERKLFPGDYNYGAPGAGDERVWSESGCTCVLITSTTDVLR